MQFTGPATHRQLEEIAPIGNSPTFMSTADARKALPLWMNTSIAIFKDADAAKVGGGEREKKRSRKDCAGSEITTCMN